MAEVIPAIIAKNFEELAHKIAVIEGFAVWAQIDVMDGIFTPPITFNDPAQLQELKTNVKLEAHLMIANPEKNIDAWFDSPVERILIHYESTTPEHVHTVLRRGEKQGKDVGIALKFETPVSVLDEFFTEHPSLRSIQLMGIAEIGYHGHPFEEATIEKISALRAKHPGVIIEIDGGVTEENIASIVHAGAMRVVAGSAIFTSDDPRRAYDALRTRAENV